MDNIEILIKRIANLQNYMVVEQIREIIISEDVSEEDFFLAYKAAEILNDLE